MTVVAIDGPAGAGKSSVGRAVARTLGWRFVDTGAMYRAVALAALERGVDIDDAEGMTRLAEALHIDAGPDRTTVQGCDVTHRIRQSDVTEAVSKVSSHPGVREVLVRRQRELAARGNVVMEGRDVGAFVTPDAEVKVFLTAALEERARRRARQLGARADNTAVQQVAASLDARDSADAARTASPFARASDAVVIDSTEATFEEVVERILEAIRDARGGR